jgi:GNAT superfamily N-acetyltransferase
VFNLRELQPGQVHLAALTLGELRPWFDSPEAIVAQVERQRPMGYRLVASFADGESDAAAVAGFRISESLAWGHALYVDDLVTRASMRGAGHADALLSWLAAEARIEHCDQLHLDSGVGADRADAHRFYFRHGLRITSYHFARELAGS